MKHGSLFSGIGGFDLAAEWMGWENIFHCEWNEFGQKILKYYWPNAISYGDITKTDFTIWRGQIDILTGGFPCQPYSLAGKRKGKEDERHLWPEMLRAVREIQPCWVVGENVPGIINWSGGLVFNEVQTDLEAQGYEVFPIVLPACGVNAPHKRERIWFVAHNTDTRIKGMSTGENTILSSAIITDPESKRINRINGNNYHPEGANRKRNVEFDSNGKGKIIANTIIGGKFSISGESGKITANNSNIRNNGSKGNVTNSKEQRLQKRNGEQISNETYSTIKRHSSLSYWQNFPTQSPLCSRDDGISSRLDGITFPKWRNESIKAYGNAIVPQVAYQIFKAIEEYSKFEL